MHISKIVPLLLNIKYVVRYHNSSPFDFFHGKADQLQESHLKLLHIIYQSFYNRKNTAVGGGFRGWVPVYRF